LSVEFRKAACSAYYLSVGFQKYQKNWLRPPCRWGRLSPAFFLLPHGRNVFYKIRANSRLKILEINRWACAPCKNPAFCATSFQNLPFQMFQKHREITWLRSLPSRTHYSRGCVINLQSRIRVRCLWLRPDILAEGVAREGGSTRLAFLEMCAFVSEEPSAGRHHCSIA
jgi:hypothetical protein